MRGDKTISYQSKHKGRSYGGFVGLAWLGWSNPHICKKSERCLGFQLDRHFLKPREEEEGGRGREREQNGMWAFRLISYVSHEPARFEMRDRIFGPPMDSKEVSVPSLRTAASPAVHVAEEITNSDSYFGLMRRHRMTSSLDVNQIFFPL